MPRYAALLLATLAALGAASSRADDSNASTTTPTETTPAPPTPVPTVAPGGACGNDKDGPSVCPEGQYCQPWNPSYYQCRSIGSDLCGAQLTGWDFYGDDLAKVQVDLPELCCDQCHATTGCTAYTFVNYNADGKAYCYLKKGLGTIKSTVGVVSAVIVTSPTTTTPTTTPPSPTTPIPTAPAPTTSVPTTATPTAAPGEACGNDRDGPMACPTGQYCQPWNPSFYQCRSIGSDLCGTQRTGVDFYGDDLATVQVDLPELCCAKCRATTGCVGYTFVNYNADGKAYCYLKKGSGTAKAATGVVSATIVTTPVTPAPTRVTPKPTSVTPKPTTKTPKPSTAAPCVGAFQQCGGNGSPDLCCQSGLTCKQWSSWLSQCIPL